MPKSPIYFLSYRDRLPVYVEVVLLAFFIHFINLQKFDLLCIKFPEPEGHVLCTMSRPDFLNIL